MGLHTPTDDRHHSGLTEPAAAFFEKRGARMLGVADNSFVFQDPADSSKVIKLSLAPEDGWTTWARWTMRVRESSFRMGYDPKHLPRVFEYHNLGALTVARMERLEPIAPSSSLRRHLRTHKRSPLELAEKIEVHSLVDLLTRAHTIFPDAHWDLGPNNWMQRPDGTLVLNDPISHLRQ